MVVRYPALLDSSSETLEQRMGWLGQALGVEGDRPEDKARLVKVRWGGAGGGRGWGMRCSGFKWLDACATGLPAWINCCTAFLR